MTDLNPIGTRIAAYRRKAGFDRAADLAAAIPNDRITTSVIQNIESGRKADISVTQLLEISYALGITPVMLLAPTMARDDRVNLPGLSEPIASMTSGEFDRWITSHWASTIPLDDVHSDWAREAAQNNAWMRALYDIVTQWTNLANYPDGRERRMSLVGQASGLLYRLTPVEEASLEWVPDDLLKAVAELRSAEDARLRSEAPLDRSDGDD